MKGQVVVAFLLGLTSSIANAQAFQANKPIICDETVKVIQALTEKFNEKPVWTANDQQDKSHYSLFINDKTGSWTLLQMTPEVTCILGVGEGSKFFSDAI